MRLRLWRTFWAAFGSPQKPGSAIFVSRPSASERRGASSKIAADVRGPRSQRFETLPQVCAHGCLLPSILVDGRRNVAATRARAIAAQAWAKTLPWRV